MLCCKIEQSRSLQQKQKELFWFNHNAKKVLKQSEILITRLLINPVIIGLISFLF